MYFEIHRNQSTSRYIIPDTEKIISIRALGHEFIAMFLMWIDKIRIQYH